MFTCQYDAFLLDDCVELFYIIIMFLCVYGTNEKFIL